MTRPALASLALAVMCFVCSPLTVGRMLELAAFTVAAGVLSISVAHVCDWVRSR